MTDVPQAAPPNTSPQPNQDNKKPDEAPQPAADPKAATQPAQEKK